MRQFDDRFSDFGALRKDLILFENPMEAKIVEQAIYLQEELCDSQNDIFLKCKKEEGVEFLKTLSESKYLRIRKFGRCIFSMFGSTYLCKSSFSVMNHIKSKRRANLTQPSLVHLMRTAISNIPVEISALIAKHQRIRPSTLSTASTSKNGG